MKFSESEIRAVIVCVNYHDFLTVTLPKNARHFKNTLIISSKTDRRTIETVELFQSMGYPIELYLTESFWDDGADFNKWKALEEGLSYYGRHGWLCNMDADVLWPHIIPDFDLNVGNLYGPTRRMMAQVSFPIPDEREWSRQFPLHRNLNEIAGFSQIFHADDPALRKQPWFEQNWKHAGGGDSMFQLRWTRDQKIRPPFEVLHLGENGHNWCGRATTMLDGEVPIAADQKRLKVREYIRNRRRYLPSGDPFAGEKIN